MFTLKEIERDALDLAKKAGELLVSMQKDAFIHKNKGAGDYSTSADIASEQLSLEFIKSKYPDHSVLSEEAGFYEGSGPITWIIDPLDETRMYKHGMSDFNYLLSLEKDQETFFGLILRPGLNKLYIAKKGMGSYEASEKLIVSQVKNLADAFLTYHVFKKKYANIGMQSNIDLFNTLISQTSEVDADDLDNKNFILVAKGVADGFIRNSPGGGWWDVAPGILLVQEAGGKVTNLMGQPIKNHDMSHGIIATNGLIHDELISLVEKHYR